MDDIKNDLPMAMMIAAFTGISWYIGVEINISLFILFKRRRGLYFWACALTSWGVMLQPLFIILGDFGVWKDPVGSVVMIYLTWLIMVVPQSWVLYSRLYLLMNTARPLKAIKYVLVFNSIVFSVPTIVIGTIAQSTTTHPHVTSFNIIWDRIQLVVFFVQETALSILYIFQTRKYLHGRSPLRERAWSNNSTVRGSVGDVSHANNQKSVLWQLVYANALIIALDITLLGIQCADLFYLQGAIKPCVYGIKLKIEFVILNRLINTVRQPGGGVYFRNGPEESGSRPADSASRHVRGDGKSDGMGVGVNMGLRHKKSGSVTDPAAEESDGVQLVESNGRGFRSYSGESQTPIYQQGTESTKT